MNGGGNRDSPGLFSVADSVLGLVFENQLEVIAVRNRVVPDKPAGLALLHAVADPVKTVREADGAECGLAGDFLLGCRLHRFHH